MTRFIPNSPAHNSSDAEIWLYRKLGSLSDDYVVLHSLGLKRHDHKSWSEIDFTIVGPEGVFLIEVKGGVVSRKNGEWFTTSKAGKTSSLGRGPFSQVGGAEAATRRFLEDRLEWLSDVTMGYWVYMPDCRLSVDDLGVDPECYFDAAHSQTTATHLVGRVRSYWANRRGRNKGLSPLEVQLVINELCAEIPQVPSMRRDINDVVERIHSATLEQHLILQAAADNPRLFVKGPAGSGKSTLAMQEAKSHADKDRSVLICCQSAGLKNLFQKNCKGVDQITVVEMHEIARLIKNHSKFDMLIVDEAQDVLEVVNLKDLNSVLSGGLDNGTWRVFLDPFQGNASTQLDDAIEELGKYAPLFLNMNRNVRTTTQIAVTSSALAYVDRILGGIDGPEVEFIYSVPGREVQDVIGCVQDLLDKEVQLNEIVVVAQDVIRQAMLSRNVQDFISFSETSNPRGRIRLASVSEIKGLESVAIVYVNPGEIRSDKARRDAYVSCTRATTLLRIIVSNEIRNDVIEAYAALALRNPAR